jgi:hypothetical protein
MKKKKRKDLFAERTLESLKEMQSGPWQWSEGRGGLTADSQ